MIDLNSIISIIILTINDLNMPIKRERLSEWIKKKQGPSICCLQEICFKYEDRDRLKVKEWKMTYHANANE